MKKILGLTGLFLASITPAFGAIIDLGSGGNFSFGTLTALINSAVPVLIALGIVFFVYALIKFLLNSDNEEARTNARYQIIYSVIVLAVIIGVWGLVNFVLSAFGLNPNSIVTPPAPAGPSTSQGTIYNQ